MDPGLKVPIHILYYIPTSGAVEVKCFESSVVISPDVAKAKANERMIGGS
jgi:hypothetical protein